MNRLLVIALVIIVASLASCKNAKVVVDGEKVRFNEALKSNDKDLKFTCAKTYYEREDYLRALPLLEDLMTMPGVQKFSELGEKIYFYFAYSHFGIGDYYLANYYFRNFTKIYPSSIHAEECSYMGALCNVRSSPDYSLDQKETSRAIDGLQLFLNKYPESIHSDTCYKIIRRLREKLEYKSYMHAKQYYKTEFYKSAVIALNNFSKEYPNSEYTEEVLFLILKSNFSLATNSIVTKKQERFEDTIKSYHTFVDAFRESKFKREAESFHDSAAKELEKLKT